MAKTSDQLNREIKMLLSPEYKMDVRLGNVANIEMLADMWNKERDNKIRSELDEQVSMYLSKFSNADIALTAAAREWWNSRITGFEHLAIRPLLSAATRAHARLSAARR